MFTDSNEDVIVTAGEYKVTLEKALRLSVINIDGINMNPSVLSEGDDIYSNIIGNVTINALGGNDSIENNASFITILGGADNDTINGGANDDIFIYKPGEGNDTIMDYSSGDMLQILGGTFSKSAFSNNKLTLTIDGGGKVIFDNVTTSTDFNINGTIYTISGNKLK